MRIFLNILLDENILIYWDVQLRSKPMSHARLFWLFLKLVMDLILAVVGENSQCLLHMSVSLLGSLRTCICLVLVCDLCLRQVGILDMPK